MALPVIDILKLDQGVQFKATLRVFNGEEKLVGPGKLELLQFIQETGSISQAAKKNGSFLQESLGYGQFTQSTL